MNTFLAILLIAAMIATLIALVRGIVAFLRTTEADLMAGGTGPSVSASKQNKAMFQRILFQGIAIAIIAVLLLLRN